MVILACEVASGDALEAYDGVSDLQISFFFQVSQNSSSEEDFTLTHPKQVVIQFQSFDLNGGNNVQLTAAQDFHIFAHW